MLLWREIQGRQVLGIIRLAQPALQVLLLVANCRPEAVKPWSAVRIQPAWSTYELQPSRIFCSLLTFRCDLWHIQVVQRW